MIVDFRKGSRVHPTQGIDETMVERVNYFEFFRVHTTKDLTWSLNTSHLIRKAKQHHHFIRRLTRVNLPHQLLCNFYRSTVENILQSCITVGMAAPLIQKGRSCIGW